MKSLVLPFKLSFMAQVLRIFRPFFNAKLLVTQEHLKIGKYFALVFRMPFIFIGKKLGGNTGEIASLRSSQMERLTYR